MVLETVVVVPLTVKFPPTTTLLVTFKLPSVPTEVKLEAVTPLASVFPERVPAAAVTVISAVPSKLTPLMALAVAKAVAVAHFELHAVQSRHFELARPKFLPVRIEHLRNQVYEQNAVAYKLAQQQLISASEEAKAALEEERRRSARAVTAADEAAEAERAKERARFGQSMKGLSRVMTMGLDGPDMPDMDEIREMLLVMVEGGDPMAKV